jgi:hypothetical protein
VQQLEPMLDQDATLGTVLADAGYNAATETADRELLIATQKDYQQRAALREAPPPRGRMPKNLMARQRMDRKLRTKPGRALYRLRGQTVERFMMHGIKACRGEWKLHTTCANYTGSPSERQKTRRNRRSHSVEPVPPTFYPADLLPPPTHVASAEDCSTGSEPKGRSRENHLGRAPGCLLRRRAHHRHGQAEVRRRMVA